MGCCELVRQARRNGSQQVVAAWCCAQQQQQPCALQVLEARASGRATPRACPASLPRQRTPGFQSSCSARPDPVLAPAGSSFPSSAEARRRRRQRCQKPCSLRLRSRREFSEGVPGRWRDDNDVCAARKAGSARSGTDCLTTTRHMWHAGAGELSLPTSMCKKPAARMHG